MAAVVQKLVVSLLFGAVFLGSEAQLSEVEEAIELAKRADAKAQPNEGNVTDVAADARNAHKAAKMAKQAANVAAEVANHSVQVIYHAKHALQDAHDAVHNARANAEGLSSDQKNSLKAAEKRLHEATKATEYGQVQDAKYVHAGVANKNLKELEKKMEKQSKPAASGKRTSEVEELRRELDELKQRLKDLEGKANEDELKKLQKQLKELEKAMESRSRSLDEIKAEIEKLRDQIKRLEKKAAEAKKSDASAIPEGEGFDIDTQMPYGDLEPFGREDTAQELTEASIHESDEMVDQIEKAEVSEEKRAVFRALTRLRGAAITSYDGVARSQTGNIDHYNRNNQWRKKHPVRHLADEESDVNKWAFPENAD